MAQEFEALQAEIMIPRMIYLFAESGVSIFRWSMIWLKAT